MTMPLATSHDPLRTSGKPIFFGLNPGSLLELGLPPTGVVRLVARGLGGMQKEALVASAGQGTPWRLASDEGAYLAGLDAAPCPLSFFTVGLVSEIHSCVTRLAMQAGQAVRGLRLVLDSYYTMRGSALQGTMVGGARDVRITAQAEAGVDRDKLGMLVHDAVRVSAIARLLGQPLVNRFALTLDGNALTPAGLAAIRDIGTPAGDDLFDAAQPALRDWSELIVRGGLTPRAAHTVTLAGGSLAPEQDRVLHVRGVSTQRPDQLLEVEQWLFNPHGSMFRFLCDPSPRDGSVARAPGPQAYAAAGIAFCFMTQFGRYASIARLPLEDCRLVQDLSFPDEGPAQPVETAVRIGAGISAKEAATLLQMAEQTCFLHALCKSTVRIRIAARDWAEGLPPPAEG